MTFCPNAFFTLLNRISASLELTRSMLPPDDRPRKVRSGSCILGDRGRVPALMKLTGWPNFFAILGWICACGSGAGVPASTPTAAAAAVSTAAPAASSGIGSAPAAVAASDAAKAIVNAAGRPDADKELDAG